MMVDGFVDTKAELMELIDRDWSALNQFLKGLNLAQWLDVRNADGWAIKDHVAHLAAWEQSMIALLNSRPRHTGLQVSEELYLSEDVDAINEAIFVLHKDEPLDQVQAHFLATHQELMNLIRPMTDEDMWLPYAHFLPDEPGEGEGPPIIDKIYGNTTYHYREHLEWMQEQLNQA
ncbi:MAG: ClbS/DfsB family four-helix bundle protein [Anaerolineae bacterium]|nr:ClbS/DfsB family four-helix bundle protein [Anaerolineae bacterium]